MSTCKRLFAAFLVCTVVAGCFFVMPGVSAASDVGYRVSGYYDDASGSFLAQIYIQNVNALGGRFALSFDQSKLFLTSTSSLSAAVKKGSGVTITTEGLEDSLLLSQEEGYAMFAWYPNANNLDASTKDILIATVSFKLKSGVSESDFDWNTFGLRYVNASIMHNWGSGAAVTAVGLTGYSSNATNNDYYCNVTCDYPGADRPPQKNAHTVSIKVTDLFGNPLRAEVTVGGDTQTAGESGTASFQLADGTYSYRAGLSGYETKTNSIRVSGSDVQYSVYLQSDEQIVQNVAGGLQIEFQPGDSAAYVTGAVGLPTTGDQGASIAWTSSRPEVVTSQGIVVRQKTNTPVTMTALVTLRGAETRTSFPLTVIGTSGTDGMKDEDYIKQDLAALEVGFVPGDSRAYVTRDVVLAEVGKSGKTMIQWESSDEETVSLAGMVNRPSKDTAVTLTAVLYCGSTAEPQKKTFSLNVIAKDKAADTRAVMQQVYKYLEIGFAEGDSYSHVTKNLSLTAEGSDPVIVTWTSSNPKVISANGSVSRQVDNDVPVDLTAVISAEGTEPMTKTFSTLTVLKREAEDSDNDTLTPSGPENNEQKINEEIVRKDKEALKIGYAPGDSADYITSDLTLPATGEYGSSITWSSSAPDVISISGEVRRPAGSSQDVALTAVIRKGNAIETKRFENQKVKGTGSGGSGGSGESDDEIVGRVADALEIGYQSGDSAKSVSRDLILAAKGSDDTVISWQSSHPNIISENGNVRRPAVDTAVTLTAAVSRNGVRKTKSFAPVAVISSSKNAGEESSLKLDPEQPETAERFGDLTGFEWARDAILELADAGVINGTGENTFSPDAPIIRGDFITLIMRMLKLEGDINQSFEDVAADSYYYQPVSLAKSLGIINGVDETHFEPESAISRQDMMTMTCRALNQLGRLDSSADADLNQFGDGTLVSDYAQESVRQLVGLKLIAGDADGRLCPMDNTTRAEAAVFLWRIYSL